jgi:hypothetical protein
MIRQVYHELVAKLRELKIYYPGEFITVVAAVLLMLAAFCFLIVQIINTH